MGTLLVGYYIAILVYSISDKGLIFVPPSPYYFDIDSYPDNNGGGKAGQLFDAKWVQSCPLHSHPLQTRIHDRTDTILSDLVECELYSCGLAGNQLVLLCVFPGGGGYDRVTE